MYRLSRRFRRRFGAKDTVDGRKKDEVEHKIVLLDGSDLTFNLHVSWPFGWYIYISKAVRLLYIRQTIQLLFACLPWL